MSDTSYKHCPYSDEIPEDFYTEEWTGIIFKADVYTRNGHYYKSEVLCRRLEDDWIKSLISTGQLFGEFKYDDVNINNLHDTIRLHKVAISFTDLWIDNNGSVFAKFKCVNNQYGKIIYDKLNKGLPVYFGIRCIGRCDEECNIIDIYRIITFDIISSCPYNIELTDKTYPNGKYERILEVH